MATHEHTINDALAELLRETRQAWRFSDVVRSENTEMLRGSAARPDILIIEPNVSPVTVEAESLPAATAESDAMSRIGEHIRRTGATILSSIAIRYPVRLSTKQGAALRNELIEMSDLDMALFTGKNATNLTRWPRSGWIHGSVADLSILIQAASVPPDVIERAADELVTGVTEAAGLLEDISHTNVGAVDKIAKELCQEDSEQTRRMATTILANAFVFQEGLAGGPGKLSDVRNLEQLRSATSGLTKSSVLEEWRKILQVNYWPIFDIARRILEVIPAPKCKPLINRLAVTAGRLVENRLMRSHDLTGAVFQRLIADRKFLAAFYTTPASASLLIGLAITANKTPNNGLWSNTEDVKSLRIADFACGTGTLLSAAYQRIGQLYELHGGDAEAVHPDMMADCILGCDVLPAAAHLTASMISGAHPTVKYTHSSIMTLAYGKQPDGGIALGSLDLLDTQRKMDILDITAKAAGGMGESKRELWLSIPHASFDVIVMNPPFTRSTVHEADRLNVPNPMFAAFASTAEEQRLMSAATKRLTAGTSAHGNAGEASIFLALADRKLKPGGTLALVMPLSLMLGESWGQSRTLLSKNYSGLFLVTIADAGHEGLSFSADTGMGECLIVGQKSISPTGRATFVVLKERPAYPLSGACTAAQIRALSENSAIHRLEDGPVGGTLLRLGNDVVGEAIDAPLSESDCWKVARIADLSLAQTAYQIIVNGRMWLPSMTQEDAVAIPITAVGQISTSGPIHRDINGRTPGGGIRGPFDIVPLEPQKAPTFPALWSHEADRERCMMFGPDSEAIPRAWSTAAEKESLEFKIKSVWDRASHCHFNCDFRFNSQSTGMQFTPERAIGGTAWLSLSLSSIELEKTIVTWSNTTFGILLRWWHSNKQQNGRGRIGKSMLDSMPVLDVTKLSPAQIEAAVSIFDDLCSEPMLAINEIDIDKARQELDRRFATEVLEIAPAFLENSGPVDLLRKKLALEPSVNGGKRR